MLRHCVPRNDEDYNGRHLIKGAGFFCLDDFFYFVLVTIIRVLEPKLGAIFCNGATGNFRTFFI